MGIASLVLKGVTKIGVRHGQKVFVDWGEINDMIVDKNIQKAKDENLSPIAASILGVTGMKQKHNMIESTLQQIETNLPGPVDEFFTDEIRMAQTAAYLVQQDMMNFGRNTKMRAKALVNPMGITDNVVKATFDPFNVVQPTHRAIRNATLLGPIGHVLNERRVKRKEAKKNG